jgi:hypothetical protein
MSPAKEASQSLRPATDHRSDEQHDFDFQMGTWKTHLKRLLHPLSGSTTWVEYDGTTTVRKVWNGRANLLELEVNGPPGHIEALSLRLYNPDAHQWSLNFANSAGGVLGIPTIGGFKDGRGEFFDQETLGPRAIFVKFAISRTSSTSCHFEQFFSTVSAGRFAVTIRFLAMSKWPSCLTQRSPIKLPSRINATQQAVSPVSVDDRKGELRNNSGLASPHR